MNGVFILIRIFLRIELKLTSIIEIMQMQHAYIQNSRQNAPVWLDNQDVMQKLKISESTLRRRRLEGTILWTRIKGKYYYKEDDIQAALNKGWTDYR
ncbi:MAG: helix-turn-helix domain-containing protein [Daejeonella sp.]